MDKCFYHTKTEAVSMCMGCKMPICQTCKDEGKKGFCDHCIKKVASLGEQVADARKTGVLQAAHKVTMVKAAGRPTAAKNVTYCFHHFDIIAASTCPTCNRPFCPACVNSAGICSHCAKHNPAAQERMYGPNERGRRIEKEMRDEKIKKSWQLREYAIAGVLVVVLMIAWKTLHKPVPKKDATAEVLSRLRDQELTPAERAMLGEIKRTTRVTRKETTKNNEPPPKIVFQTPEPADGGSRSSGGGTPARVRTGGGAASSGGGEPVQVAIDSPSDGAIVSGGTGIHVTVSGSADRVVVSVDGTSIGSTRRSASFAWSAAGKRPGPHTVRADGYSGGSLQSTSTITINVNR